jgi:uncharacterized protein YfiM (DUF2279 family)
MVMAVGLAVAFPSPASGQQADEIDLYALRHGWFSLDKAYHFGVSAIGSAALYGLSRELGAGRWGAFVFSAGAMTTLGLFRELYDEESQRLLTRRGFSRKDVVWNSLGITFRISVTDLSMERRRRAGAPAPAALREGSETAPCGAGAAEPMPDARLGPVRSESPVLPRTSCEDEDVGPARRSKPEHGSRS